MLENQTFILHSGGIDSTALINYYLKLNNTIKSLHINYGQVACKNERKAVNQICKYYNIEKINFDLKSQLSFSKGVIQGRNLFLLATALLATSFKKGQIALGIHKGTNYVDCSESFLNLINQLFSLYSNGKIVVAAPFIQFNKKQIFKYCQQESVPLEMTYSCELGLKQPCGKCPSCKELIILYGSKNWKN